MATHRVNEHAKSAYRGMRGRLVGYSSGRDTWLRGPRFAKFVGLVFDSGHCAGRTMWFHMREIE